MATLWDEFKTYAKGIDVDAGQALRQTSLDWAFLLGAEDRGFLPPYGRSAR